jgi:uridylate kinase
MAASACTPSAALLGARLSTNRHFGGRTARRAGRTAASRVPRAVAVRAGESDVDSEDDVAVERPDGPSHPHKWTRVMLKVSGEALAGKSGFGIDHEVVRNIAREVAEAALGGVQVAVVVGGGNFFRGASHEGKGLDRASADYMGMLATVMNAISMQAAVESHGVPTRVMTAFSMPEVAEPYVRRRAIRHLEKGRVVIFGAGTGNPFFTTDTGAALRAAEINAQCVLKATMVDGVYNSDPKRDPSAKLYESLTYETVQRLGLGVMDLTAITLCQENDIPVVVFNLNKEGNIASALRGNKVGTCVSSDVEKFQRADEEIPWKTGA